MMCCVWFEVVSALLDRTWEEISAREEHKTQKKLPVKQPTQEIEVSRDKRVVLSHGYSQLKVHGDTFV